MTRLSENIQIVRGDNMPFVIAPYLFNQNIVPSHAICRAVRTRGRKDIGKVALTGKRNYSPQFDAIDRRRSDRIRWLLAAVQSPVMALLRSVATSGHRPDRGQTGPVMLGVSYRS